MQRYVQPKVDVTENGSIPETTKLNIITHQKSSSKAAICIEIWEILWLLLNFLLKMIVFLQVTHYSTPYLLERYDFFPLTQSEYIFWSLWLEHGTDDQFNIVWKMYDLNVLFFLPSLNKLIWMSKEGTLPLGARRLLLVTLQFPLYIIIMHMIIGMLGSTAAVVIWNGVQ
jgi:hypothetical protein